MSRGYGYFVQVNPVERAEHAEWWGHGGAELMDEIDPGCQSEDQDQRRIGPIDPDVMADWIDRACQIRGWVPVWRPGCPIILTEDNHSRR